MHNFCSLIFTHVFYNISPFNSLLEYYVFKVCLKLVLKLFLAFGCNFILFYFYLFLFIFSFCIGWYPFGDFSDIPIKKRMKNSRHHCCSTFLTGQINHPVLITECACNPVQSRSKMAELLFESYGVPSIGNEVMNTYLGYKA